jgi:hypothetical protein
MSRSDASIFSHICSVAILIGNIIVLQHIVGYQLVDAHTSLKLDIVPKLQGNAVRFNA